MPIVGLICAVVFVPWAPLWLWLTPLPDSLQQQVNKATDFGLDGIIVYVNRTGKAPAFFSAGWKDREKQTLADPHSLFKIASISKLYIAAAATKMVHDQKLSLEDTLADHMPELVGRIENAEKITLRMMLQHRSGIPNFTDQPEYPWADLPKNNQETLALVLDKPAEFEPDLKYSYSNTNYLLIGEILDQVLGYNHHQYIRQEILMPLGLQNTYGSQSEVDLDQVMSGYFVGYEPDIKSNDHVNPGGSMIATAEDVGIFLRALNDGSLFNDEKQAIYSSVYEYEHTGLLPGYYSIARYHQDIDAVIIQFVNTSGKNTTLTSNVLYNRIVKIIHKD